MLFSYKKEFNDIKEKLRNLKSQFDRDKLDLNFYIKTEREIETLNIKIKTLNKLAEKKAKLNDRIRQQIDRLNHVRYNKYGLRDDKAKEIGDKIPFLDLSIAYRGNKKSFFGFLKESIKGLGVHTKKIEKIANQFINGYELFLEIINKDDRILNVLTENEISNLSERIKDSLFSFITYQAEDKLIINDTVNEIPKNIEELSIGQRAAALLSIILAEGNKPIIVDQPEDDIDNNTIYQGIIKTILKNKDERQFIFATHNSNIVVLGDSDNVIVCNTEKEKFHYQSGSIDKEPIQKEIIKIMEGGEDAFNKRKLIYKIWSK